MCIQKCMFTIMVFSLMVERMNAITLPELMGNYGFKTEKHTVQTDDGYILTLFHVPSLSENATAPIILLVHGIHTHSDIWALQEKNSLALMLANAGYDVWAINTRGNKYSQSHEFLRPKDNQFWNHSWHEIGLYDLPATIDYILRRKDSGKLTYVGLSTGNTAAYVMLSKKPEYNDKINAIISYGPSVYWKFVRSAPMRLFAPVATTFLKTVETLRLIDILSSQGPIIDFLKKACLTPLIFKSICSPFFLLLFGFSKGNQNDMMMKKFVENIGATSLKQIVHSTQSILSGNFLQYQDHPDFSNSGRNIFQGLSEYNLRNVRVPVALYSVGADFLVDKQDMDTLEASLPNVAFRKQLSFAYYGFLSYYLSEDAPKYLYEPTLEFIQSILKK